MRTLKKAVKTKKIEKPIDNKQQNKKNQSKKIIKTVFTDPFHYRIETLSHQDMDLLTNDFLPYLKLLRKSIITKQSSVRQKFISFKPQENPIPPLNSQQIILGIKSVLSEVKKSQQIHLVIAFYEENRYQLFEELFCQIITNKVPLIIARNSQSLQKQLSIKTLSCIGLKNSKISHQLSILASRCSVQIPWLVKKDWIGLKNE